MNKGVLVVIITNRNNTIETLHNLRQASQLILKSEIHNNEMTHLSNPTNRAGPTRFRKQLKGKCSVWLLSNWRVQSTVSVFSHFCPSTMCVCVCVCEKTFLYVTF